MKRIGTRNLGILLVSATASCATMWMGPGLAPAGDRIRVPHARHIVAKVDCLACHESVFDSKQLGDRVTPEEKKCLECHAERKSQCSWCHTEVKKARAKVRPEPTLRMSHADHLPLVKDDCARCHTKLPEPFRTTETKPTMAVCLGCHNHAQEFKNGKCDGCHVDLTRFALKPVSAFLHPASFSREHGQSARSQPDACAQCHDQTFCIDCHAQTVGLRVEIKHIERVDRDFIHRNDFLSRHSIESRADPALCMRCHGRSFCDDCHKAQNLTRLGTDPRNPHPLGWSFPGSPSFHGTEARRDIASCAACHDQGAQSNCVDCHKVGGSGGNPHPPGFTDRHPHSEIAGSGMCLVCHR